jgi:thiamine biosynthesis protein ThiI
VNAVAQRDGIFLPYSDENWEKMNYIFGIEGFGKGLEVETAVETILKTCVGICKDEKDIQVVVRRSNKQYKLTSPELQNKIVAELIKNNFDIDKKGKTKLVVKIGKKARIYLIPTTEYLGEQFLNGLGGMPASSGGRVGVMLSGGIDSPVAAWQIIKRGCKPVFIHYHSVNDFDPEKGVGEKIGNILKQLKKYYPFPFKLYAINFHPITREIVQNVEPKNRLVLYRRFMYSVSEEIMKKEGCEAYVSGESLGQVASQTLTNLSVISEVTNYEILRPLISMDKKEITALARQIGTFEESIKEYDDTCSKFLPKHPNIHSDLEEIKKLEKKIGKIKPEIREFLIE